MLMFAGKYDEERKIFRKYCWGQGDPTPHVVEVPIHDDITYVKLCNIRCGQNCKSIYKFEN